VASDRASRLQLPATYRAGRLLAEKPKLVPERWAHAVVPGSRSTLCGVTVAGLNRFQALPFDRVGHHLRCPKCDEAAGHPHAESTRMSRAARAAPQAVEPDEDSDPQFPSHE
jgi:hypothetical protein